MLPRQMRLTSPVDFRLVYRRGQKYVGRLVVMYAKKNPTGQLRFGFSVNKKLGKAVRRNQVKRWLREACWQQKGFTTEGYDIVFVARPGAPKGISYETVKKDVRSLLEKIGSKNGR